jgi:hypothetical protein
VSPLARAVCALFVAALLVPAAAAGHGNDLVPGALKATDVTDSTATLSGSAGGDKAKTWWIEYGWSLADVHSTAPSPLPAGKRPVGVSATLGGLPAGTQVYARMVVAEGTHRSDGALMRFATAAPAPATAPAPPTPSGPAPAPQLGATAVIAPTAGAVRVRAPGHATFTPLTAAAALPLGTVVDARRGTLTLATALPGGAVQDGAFRGARFAVRQSRDGFTDLHLRGRPAGCRRAGAARVARKRPRQVRLWGRDHGGRFRTHGRDSVTTVRGTEWTVTERCRGTLTEVAEGAVDVRVRRTGRVVHVTAGERHLVRHRR